MARKKGNIDIYEAFYDNQDASIARVDRELEQRIALLKERRIPENYPPEIVFYRSRHLAELTRYGGYTLVAYEWVRRLAGWLVGRKCLEVMAGCGALSKALQDCGVDVVATDDYSWSISDDAGEYSVGDCEEVSGTDHLHPWFREPFTTVEKLDCISAVKKYGAQISYLICAWPSPGNAVYQAVKALYEINPDAQVIYIGGNAQVCADEAFLSSMHLVRRYGFPQAMADFRAFPPQYEARPLLLRYGSLQVDAAIRADYCYKMRTVTGTAFQWPFTHHGEEYGVLADCLPCPDGRYDLHFLVTKDGAYSRVRYRPTEEEQVLCIGIVAESEESLRRKAVEVFTQLQDKAVAFYHQLTDACEKTIKLWSDNDNQETVDQFDRLLPHHADDAALRFVHIILEELEGVATKGPSDKELYQLEPPINYVDEMTMTCYWKPAREGGGQMLDTWIWVALPSFQTALRTYETDSLGSVLCFSTELPQTDGTPDLRALWEYVTTDEGKETFHAAHMLLKLALDMRYI